MPWTGEDTKDVFKKVLGGLIAAAVITLAYAVMEQMQWYFAAFLGIGLLILVVLLVWKLVPQKARGATVDESPSDIRAAQAHLGEPDPAHEAEPARPSPSDELPLAMETDSKALKKIAKAEQKRLKKEAKARKKSAE
ncbi:MAG: hypothetical protein JSU93_06375 [Methanobacteriota archaeon]|nr:MAG: hypothetical protein JSU93_06375 [Euryarchaeota archaeon]